MTQLHYEAACFLPGKLDQVNISLVYNNVLGYLPNTRTFYLISPSPFPGLPKTLSLSGSIRRLISFLLMLLSLVLPRKPSWYFESASALSLVDPRPTGRVLLQR
ncbi:hypothetical protein RRG08_062711 [Elysia crispata]|uniref:Uncharacterized protein n=1 Tax=Elysia crispata TaxID=231223 RepID=A0AAE1DVW0_9GAST|nr:hypothetical protein RRG08_062711 [Elysia crispata]